MPEPHLRAADADRAAVVTRLDASRADGRLDLAEYEDRAARAHAARTYGELAELTTDLPRPARPQAERSPVAPGPPLRGVAARTEPVTRHLGLQVGALRTARSLVSRRSRA